MLACDDGNGPCTIRMMTMMAMMMAIAMAMMMMMMIMMMTIMKTTMVRNSSTLQITDGNDDGDDDDLCLFETMITKHVWQCAVANLMVGRHVDSGVSG